MLKTYNIKQVFDAMEPEFSKDYLQYFMIEDVWDYHVLRIIKGDYEGNKDVFTVEFDKIPKYDIAEQMSLDVGKADIRSAFTCIYPLTIAKAIVELDLDRGYENEGCKTFSTMEEALQFVDQNDTPDIEVVGYEEEVEPEKHPTIPFCESLLYMRPLFMKMLQDERSTRYQNILVLPYGNGREQGYALRFLHQETNKTYDITFAQSSGTDKIVVYYGLESERTVSGAVSDEAYHNRQEFRYMYYNETMDYIFGLLDKYAPKSKNEDCFSIHESIQIAEEVVEMVQQDERSSLYLGYIQCLQVKGILGYQFYTHGNNEEIRYINVSTDEKGNIQLFTTNLFTEYFNELTDDMKVETYNPSDKQKVVDRIFDIYKEVQKTNVK